MGTHAAAAGASTRPRRARPWAVVLTAVLALGAASPALLDVSASGAAIRAAGPRTGVPAHLGPAAAAPGAHAGILPPANPPANIPMSSTNVVVATDYARSLEDVGPLVYNVNAFDALSVPQQIFVVENLERTARGEPPISAMTTQLDGYAQTGANDATDPTFPATLTGGAAPTQGGSIWAGGTETALESNYLWMYEDGWGGTGPTYNGDCTSPTAAGCWGHRDVILTEYAGCPGPPTLVMGAAVNDAVMPGGSFAAVFMATCGRTPTDETYTWAQAEAALGLTPPVVGMAVTPSAKGYWLVAADGTIDPFGDAENYGSMAGQQLNEPIVGMAATPDGKGYWLVASDGGIFSFGDAHFYGSTGDIHLNQPIVGMTATPDGKGYWFVAADGGVFAFGDAGFHGSMGGQPLNQPVVGMAADLATGGYWLVASDGGIFSFDAPFDGSTGNIHLNEPIVGMEAAPNGSGYRFVAADGGVFCFDLPFAGSMGGQTLNAPVVSMAPWGAGGYWLVGTDGSVFSFGGAPFYGSTG